MNRFALRIDLDAETPAAAIKAIQQLAARIDRWVVPQGLSWGAFDNDWGEVDVGEAHIGDAYVRTTVLEKRANNRAILTHEFISGHEPLLPWTEDYEIRFVSIKRDHTLGKVSSEPGIKGWFLFRWYESNHAFITNGDEWAKMEPRHDEMLNPSNVAENLEVSYDVPQSEYLTTEDQKMMQWYMERYVGKEFKDS